MAFHVLIVCFFLLDYTMSNLVIDVVGYSAAVITNVSIFPQAYDVYIIVSTAEYNKLIGLSLICSLYSVLVVFYGLAMHT